MQAPKPHFKKIFIILLLLPACSGLEKSEHDKLREKNAHGEYVYRRHDDQLYQVEAPIHHEREPYLWEKD